MAHDAAPEDRRRWLGLAMLSLGVAMIIADISIVNVALPQMIRELHITLVDAEWINTIYSLTFAALLLTAGWIGDLAGRKRLFVIGVAVFVVSSALAGLAPTGSLLIAARFAQGIGGAIILPSTLSTVNATFRGQERAIAFGIWGSVIGGMAAVGPLLGGWLTTNFSWRWAFYINVPVGFVAIAVGLFAVRESRDEGAPHSFDLPGFLTFTPSLAALIFGLIEGNRYGWLRPKEAFGLSGLHWPLHSVSIIPFAFGVAVVCFAAFLAVERARQGRAVLVDFPLFRLASFSIGNAVTSIVSVGEFGILFVLPLFLQAVLGYSAFRTGVVLMPLAVAAFAAGPLAAPFAARFGARRVVSTGMALEAIGIFMVGLLIAPDISPWTLAPWLAIYGVGVGLATAQLASVVLADVPAAKSGQASGINSTIRQTGAAVGIALLGTILAVTLGSGTRARLRQVPDLPPQARAAIATAVERSAGQAIVGLRGQPGNAAVVMAADQAFAHAVRRTSEAAAGMVALGFALSLFLPESSWAGGAGGEEQAGAVPSGGAERSSP